MAQRMAQRTQFQDYASQPKNSTAKLLSGTNYWGRAHLAKIWEYTLKQFI